MAVRRILVPIRGDGKGENVLDHALALGRPFNAHIEVVQCRPGTKDLIPFGVSVPAILRKQIEESGEELAGEEEARITKLFHEYAARHNLPLIEIGAKHPSDKMSATWRVERGKQANMVSLRGRLADVIAVAKPDRERNLGRNTLEAALMNTGSLVMMCPMETPGRIGAHVAIAWNGSRESARAIALAMPVLRSAEKITIMTIKGEKLELDGTAVLGYFSDHDLAAEHVEIPAGDGVGAALLAGARTAGADSLLMGAYGNSRGKELVFGGVTRYVVEHATMPVFMAH